MNFKGVSTIFFLASLLASSVSALPDLLESAVSDSPEAFDVPDLLTSAVAVGGKVFDVTKLGARADGRSDISSAVTNAWKQACASPTPATVLIPRGNYFMGKVVFQGPCKAPIKLQVQGNIKAPARLDDTWVSFSNIAHLTVFGGGVFDGQGQSAWDANHCGTNPNCKFAAKNFNFNDITNSQILNVKSLNSKNFHVSVINCKDLTFNHFTVSAPGSSINTDGIHIGRSIGVTINNTNIGTGDDCISLGDGSQKITVYNVTCGPGHGISVGSLGRYPDEQPVTGVHVSKCTISNTQNGVRIKSWPGMYGNTASDMHFDDIQMNNVNNPILIDQVYCPWNKCNAKAASKVKLSDVRFSNIRGTSADPVAVKLSCSSSFPCQKVVLNNINLVHKGRLGPIKSQCTNVRPTVIGKIPPGC